MNKKIIIIIMVLISVIGICTLLRITNSKSVQINDVDENESPKDSIMYNSNSTLEKLKEEYKYSGENDIYQVETEKDGRKVIKVKSNINYKVAFAGMIKNTKPEFEELDLLYEKNYPTQCGIWIKTSDAKRVQEYLDNNEYLNSKYEINNEGYLKILATKNQTEYDKKLEKLINGDKQYLFSISSTCYMIEPVTGMIVDNPYNELDSYQTYEYFKDENKMIVFITENLKQKMDKDDIFLSVMQLVEVIE